MIGVTEIEKFDTSPANGIKHQDTMRRRKKLRFLFRILGLSQNKIQLLEVAPVVWTVSASS
jgi:hypothetical protein